ncbi:MAG: hypothetical protein IAE84_01075 [Saprospiraceae bacterium]|jgi:hypothetical protein|nr:hypothetical protein [Saprospiraceae bacterium]HRD83381.1 hypothetical protein [Saprospiraceae bacterium]HRK83807.1 hypothetical protein [Saprospiraceae bacterium]
MKLPKELLKAIVLGIGIAATATVATSCDKVEITTSDCDESCKNEETCVHVLKRQPDYNCPACGMG